jgi:hypothetical protein
MLPKQQTAGEHYIKVVKQQPNKNDLEQLQQELKRIKKHVCQFHTYTFINRFNKLVLDVVLLLSCNNVEFLTTADVMLSA